ncbi:hypothetical protein HHL17_24330 [Chitinophaga sp. G-6-1-13]|uniref:Uncharacterized protein n=1 Tax=Chitinophaga fulva TaxID=2728842 RepID=A0A848GQU2_9BACT|nr:hypothetical protein [Chitinophaga fulva]NML40347.1 hypothetical protein [Chitinophaga fulva]
MEPSWIKGRFKAIESYTIRRRNEVYILGELLDGHVQAGWYAVISFNSSIGMSVKIESVSTVKIFGFSRTYTLLVLKDDDMDEWTTDFVFGMKIGNEPLRISEEGPNISV